MKNYGMCSRVCWEVPAMCSRVVGRVLVVLGGACNVSEVPSACSGGYPQHLGDIRIVFWGFVACSNVTAVHWEGACNILRAPTTCWRGSPQRTWIVPAACWAVCSLYLRGICNCSEVPLHISEVFATFLVVLTRVSGCLQYIWLQISV